MKAFLTISCLIITFLFNQVSSANINPFKDCNQFTNLPISDTVQIQYDKSSYFTIGLLSLSCLLYTSPSPRDS